MSCEKELPTKAEVVIQKPKGIFDRRIAAAGVLSLIAAVALFVASSTQASNERVEQSSGKPLFNPTPTISVPIESRQVKDALNVENLLNAVAEYRKKYKLPLLSKDTNLCRLAAARLKDMEKITTLNHDNFYPRWNELRQSHPEYLEPGENLFRYVSKPSSPRASFIIEAWHNSEPHRITLQNPVYNSACAETNGMISVLELAAVNLNGS